MRLTEYGREPHKRKEYVHQPALLLVGVDVSQAKHHTCLGTQTIISCRQLACTHTREGFRRFEQTLRNHRVQTRCQRLLIAMEPSGLSWPALDERLKSCGYAVCLVHCQAVRHNRQTMPEGTRKTDDKDAYSVFALLRPGQFFLPVARDPELQAASRLMQRHMARKTRSRQLRQPRRAALHLAFPEFNPLRKALTPPTALRFLQPTPTPAAVLRNGRTGFLARWQLRRHCGQWRSDTFHTIDDLAQDRLGLTDPYHLDAFESIALAHALADALATHPMSREKVLALLAPRPACQLLVTLPRIGRPTAAAILTALGAIGADTHGKPRVTRAGLALCVSESGARIRTLPKLSPVGRAYLR
jgi:transposase